MAPDQTEQPGHGGQQDFPHAIADLHDPDHPGSSEPTKRQSVSETHMTPVEKRLKQTDGFPETMEGFKRALQEKVGLGVSFDLVLREMVFAGRRCALFYVNGFAKDTALIEVIKRLTYAEEGSLADKPVATLQEMLIPHNQVDPLDSFNQAIAKALAGMTVLYVEGEQEVLVIDAKSYPVRSTGEPDLERVVRGSRDGFVETLMTNITLIRRRLRDPRLKFELMKVGKRTQTDVCFAYISDIANPELVEELRHKISKVEVDGLPLGEKQLEELLVSKIGWNPYPSVRYSERPDVVSTHLLEGHVVLMADTSPSAMILPCTMFQLMQHAEEYRQTPAVGTYLRWVRYFGILSSLFIMPIWYLMVAHPELKPPGMPWIGPENTGHLPVLLQFLLAELGVDLMRMAAIHTPAPLATAMGLIAAVLIGQIAVQTGLFVNEVILYMAVATIGMFATPSYELSMANRLSRIILLLAAAIFSIPGLVAAFTIWMLVLSIQRSYKAPYMWPFIPFNAKALFTVLLRRPFGANRNRPSMTQPLDRDRKPA